MKTKKQLRWMKCYGDTKTSLILTDRAYAAFDSSWPLKIYVDDDGLCYMRGVIDADELTAAEVNEILEGWYEDEDSAGLAD